MNHEVNISQLPSAASAFPALPPGIGFDLPPQQSGAPEPQVDVFRSVHRLLRGRYLLATALAAVGALAGAAGGYFTQKPMYKSGTTVQIRTYIPPVMKADLDTTMRISQINSIVQSQAALIQSDRVIAHAMESETWRAIGRPRTPEVEQGFRDSLKVIVPRDLQDMIIVTFYDSDPRAAKAGMDSAISAYDELVVKTQDADITNQKTSILVGQQRQLRTDIKELEDAIAKETTPYGTTDVGKYQEKKLDQILAAEEEIARLDFRLALLGEPDPSNPTSKGEGRHALTPYEIAQHDPDMQELWKQRHDLDSAIEKLKARGATDENREVKSTRRQYEAIEKKIKDYAEEWNKDGGVSKGSLVTGSTVPATPEAIKAQVARLKAQRASWLAEAIEIKAVKESVETKRNSITSKRKDLDGVEERLTSIATEYKMQMGIGNVIFLKDEGIPTAPAYDKRKRTAALGFVLGGVIPFALIALVGLLDRRFRYSDQARDRGVGPALLGILPELPRDLHDPEEAAAAAHCVHQMRTMLQISGGTRKVYSITSATSGDGKTSLTLSLGLSFAASGSKTLLVDFDLVGQGLSSKLKIRPEHGMADSLESGDPGESIVATKVDRLFLLPAGRHDEEFVSRLSQGMVHQMIDSVRADFDVVIIDTGPVLGSLEANFVTSQADGVVLVVGRGQHRSLVQRALEQLTSLGARVIGLVFNRAISTDFSSSTASKSMRSVRSMVHQASPAQAAKVNESLLELDPVSRTVALDIRR